MIVETTSYQRNCPECHKSLCYSSLSSRNKAEKFTKLCKSCSHIGNALSAETKNKLSKLKLGVKNPFYGKHHTDETRKKLSKIKKGRLVDKKINEKVSKSIKLAWEDPIKRKNMISGNKWNHTKVDKGQLELIEKWNRLGFNFTSNHQIKTENGIFYVDGYDEKRNIVLEYDSPYHIKQKQTEKDLIRQNKIIDILKPTKFWRFNSVNRQFRNVLESKG